MGLLLQPIPEIHAFYARIMIFISSKIHTGKYTNKLSCPNTSICSLIKMSAILQIGNKSIIKTNGTVTVPFAFVDQSD